MNNNQQINQQIIDHIRATTPKSTQNRRRQPRISALEDLSKTGLKVIAAATIYLAILILITALS